MRVARFAAHRFVSRLSMTIALLCFSLAAHADGVSAYAVSGSNGLASSLSGAFVLDSTRNVIADVDLMAASANGSASTPATGAETAAAAPAATPEPCSFLLLITGLLATSSMARKRTTAQRGSSSTQDVTAAFQGAGPAEAERTGEEAALPGTLGQRWTTERPMQGFGPAADWNAANPA